MGNVLRVLGIVLASTLLGLVGLFLLLFTICGGLKSGDGGGVLAVCLLLMAGGVGMIVFLGRGIVATRTVSRGLAVPPAGAAPVHGAPPAYGAAPAYTGPMITPQTPYVTPAAASYAPAAPPPRPVLPLRPLAGTDVQALVGLRICLAVYILLSLGSIVFNFAEVSRFGSGVAVQLILRNILGLLPPVAVLIAVSVRNPPAGAALDAVAGLAIASILFRFGYLAFAGLFNPAFSQGDYLLAMLPRLAGFSALEAGIAGLAVYLRSRVGPLSPGALVLATLAFLFWEGLVQAVMTALLSVMF
jgi:hypothetical protein